MQPKRKSIMIETQTAGCSTKDGKNLLVLGKQLPADDFEVIVKASIHEQGAGNRIAMLVFNDDANYFWISFQHQGDCCGGPPNYVYFQKYFQGQLTASFVNRVRIDNVYLKIVRDLNEYSGYYAEMNPTKPDELDKIQWTGLGTLPWIRFPGKQLALCAGNYQDAPGVAAEFYSVWIRKK